MRLLSASNGSGRITAQVELDVRRGEAVARREEAVRSRRRSRKDHRRAIYANCRIGEIRCGQGNELLAVTTPGGELWLKAGQAIDDDDHNALKRQMIRRTIKEHLDKELRLAPLGIKVLSLFFIDRVEHYRKYDESGHPARASTP